MNLSYLIQMSMNLYHPIDDHELVLPNIDDHELVSLDRDDHELVSPDRDDHKHHQISQAWIFYR